MSGDLFWVIFRGEGNFSRWWEMSGENVWGIVRGGCPDSHAGLQSVRVAVVIWAHTDTDRQTDSYGSVIL